MERSIIVNKPMAEVQNFFQEQLTPYGIKATGVDREFSGEIGNQIWLIRLEAEKDGKRTFLKGSVPYSDSPSAIRRIFSRLKLVPLIEPDALDLRKLKALIETGEIPTIKGQPTGELSNLGRLIDKGQAAIPLVVPTLVRPRAKAKAKPAAKKSKAAPKPQAKTRSSRKESHV